MLDQRTYDICEGPAGVHQGSGLEDFWRKALAGAELLSGIPLERWSIERCYNPAVMPGMMYTRHGGFLSDVCSFDAGAFRLAWSIDNVSSKVSACLLYYWSHRLESVSGHYGFELELHKLCKEGNAHIAENISHLQMF